MGVKHFTFTAVNYLVSKPKLLLMVEVYNLEGMPVYKYRSEDNKAFEVSELESKGLPCGVYFVKIKTRQGIETAKLLIC